MPEGIAAVVEDAGDVFPDERCRRAAVLAAGLVDGICKLHIGKGQGAARVSQATAGAGHAERLARRAADQEVWRGHGAGRSEEHTSELQSLMRNSYAVFCLTKKKTTRE